MLVINTKVHILILLLISILYLAKVNSFELTRVKRQLRGRDRVNATSVIFETEGRINNRTSAAASTNSSNRSFQAATTCGGIFTQPQFIIETPQYPSNYQSNANCLYIFKGPYCETNYTLQFLDFNLEDSLGCVNDRLEVKFKDALCGSREGFKVYNTPSGTLELTFISNGDTTARGFRILVSRSVCLSAPLIPGPNGNSPQLPTTTPGPSFIPSRGRGFTPTEFPIYPSSLEPTPYLPPTNKQPPNVLYPNAKEPACCAATYSNKRFFLSSPGFPHSQSGSSQCSFTIYRANDKVCRLRIQIHYFHVGVKDESCTRGFLQIDGKLICGCHTGLKLVSPFEGHLGNTKVFRYINHASNFGSQPFSGFALEVIQDECPKRYSPDSSESLNTHAEILPRFNFYNDQFNRVGFPNLTHQEQLLPPLLNDNTEIFEPIDLGFKPRVVKHVYFFESPDFTYDVSYSYNKPREVEETSYLETTDLNALYPSGTDLNKCLAWGNNEWGLLNKDVDWQRMPKCNDIARNYPNRQESACKEYSFYKGYFQSPGYPYYYPKNLDACYRFYKQAGYCKIRLIMLDFQVEDSFDCRTDYVLLNNNFRYCGQSLANTFTLFDTSGKSYEQISFVTNDRIGGRGFRGIYEQIPCAGTEIPFTSTPPPRPPTRPPYTPTTIPPQTVSCLRNIKDAYFTIDIYDYGKDMCNFDVYRTNPNVCRLEITFATFDFPCDLEYLEIDGRTYCGKLSGQMINVMFDNKRVITILYKRVSFKPGIGSGLKLHLVGRQSSSDCVQLPPAQRILEQQVQIHKDVEVNISSKKSNQTTDNSTLAMQIVRNSEDVSVILRKKYPQACGVVINTKQNNNVQCDLILKDKNNLECKPITDTAIYVPYNDNDKLELKFKNVETIQKLEFKQMTCDNKFIL